MTKFRGQGPEPIVVRALSLGATKGRVHLGSASYPCSLGRSGRKAIKREGDGATPIGSWRMVEVRYRADRVRRPICRIALRALHMWRTDHLYDIVVVLDHNRRPRMRGAGSAIFMHLARPGYRPTEGCVALREVHLRQLLRRASRRLLHVVA
jgi:L,D-peptidoglycan transpeptidase YkuD (ErfK/YbiS/YcfS/YnhG family)